MPTTNKRFTNRSAQDLINLTDGRFKDCEFMNTDLTNSDLTNAKFTNCRFMNTDLLGATLINTEFEETNWINKPRNAGAVQDSMPAEQTFYKLLEAQETRIGTAVSKSLFPWLAGTVLVHLLLLILF